MMKKTLIAAALATVSLPSVAEIAANVTMATDYVFRGISQTDNQLAVQGGFDWEHESGFYLGTWASNIDSNFFAGPTDPQIELDLYAGFAGDIGESGVGYDVGYIRYEYPGGSGADTNEIYGALSYGDFSAQVNYSNELNFIGSNDAGWYYNVGYGTEISGFGLSAAVGYSTGDAWDDIGIDNYVDWTLGASYSIAGVDLGLAYTDTNISDSDCGSDTLCGSKVIASVSKSF